jgi:serine/threonine-protein kinase
VLSFVAGGGQGDVYLARHLGLSRAVALKLLRPEYCADPQSRSRLRREGRAAARLDHPHVIRVFDCGEHRGQLYLVMELLQGGSLADRLREGRRLAPEAAAALLAAVADGVHHAHRAGLVHRDLKPGNILFRTDGTPKVADFGLPGCSGTKAASPGSPI